MLRHSSCLFTSKRHQTWRESAEKYVFSTNRDQVYWSCRCLIKRHVGKLQSITQVLFKTYFLKVSVLRMFVQYVMFVCLTGFLFSPSLYTSTHIKTHFNVLMLHYRHIYTSPNIYIYITWESRHNLTLKIHLSHLNFPRHIYFINVV